MCTTIVTALQQTIHHAVIACYYTAIQFTRDRGPMMERKLEKKNLWLIGGALVVGAAFLGLRRLMDFDVDFDPWDDAYLY